MGLETMTSPLTEHEKPPHHPGHSRVYRAATVQGGDPAADQTRGDYGTLGRETGYGRRT